MSATTSIEWTEKTWNPVRGCSLVSEGCRSCYAMKTAHRFSGPGKPYDGLTKIGPNGPTWTGAIRTVPDALDEPLHWRKPLRIFVNSMSDLFHADVPDVFIERVFSVMALAERHTFQVLTKRPARMLAWFEARRFDVKDYAILQTEKGGECLYAHPWPLPNVWLGVSVENQHFADERIPLLLETPAAVRFVSAEPLLEAIDFTKVRSPWLTGHHAHQWLDWVIVGGESGPGARPFDVAWARSIVQQCKTAGVACFVKQLGDVPVMNEAEWRDGNMCLLNARNDKRAPAGTVPLKFYASKAGDPAEWPADLRVREFPGGDAGIAPSAAPEAQG